jgi:hypothetical protein
VDIVNKSPLRDLLTFLCALCELCERKYIFKGDSKERILPRGTMQKSGE